MDGEREVVSNNGTQPHVNPKPVRRSDSQFVSTRPSNEKHSKQHFYWVTLPKN